MSMKAFRLFVSSTFADFAAERDVLQRRAFPALEAYCTSKGYQFYPIDLRWGVNEEAQLDHRTAEICLREVHAAKQDYPPPNFLIMIGDRYGSVPLPYAIAQDEFEAILSWLEGRGRKDAARALSSVYRFDGNHLLPRDLCNAGAGVDAQVGAHTLRSRVDELSELRTAEAWAAREGDLRPILQEAADALLALGRINEAAHEKYFLSLTDQEIIHGLPGYRLGFIGAPSSYPTADGPPAIAFIREITNRRGATASASHGYFQDSSRLDALKQGIWRVLPPDHIVTARTVFGPNARISETDLADFAAQIQNKLKSAIDRHIARVETIERSPNFALESEREAHRAFAERRLEIFIGREDILAAIARYLAGDGEQPLVLHGRSGLGKSSVMARAIAEAEGAGAPVIARFAGASAASSSLRALLVSLIEDLANHGIVAAPTEFEQDAKKFSSQVNKLLASVTAPVVIFLDALDQLQKPYDLSWFPAKLPNKLKLVISVLDDAFYEVDGASYRGLRARLAREAFVEIGALSLAQGRQILLALERQSQRRLQDSQRAYIIERYGNAGGSPLYLKTAFEIARTWRSYDKTGTGRCMLAEDTDHIVAQFIAELSSVQHHEPDLVSRTLGYLAAARSGLSEKELTEILSSDAGVMQAISSDIHGTVTDKLPASVWVRLHRDLSPFLVEKQIDDQPLLQFFHRQLAQVAREQHYQRLKAELHGGLAAYFESQASKRDGRSIYSKRSLSELPFQLEGAENTTRLEEILMSPDWMQQKLNSSGPQTLSADYDQFGRGPTQNLISRTLRLITGVCARDKRQLLPQLVGRLIACSDPAVLEFLDRARGLIDPPALIPEHPGLAPPGAEIALLEGHTGAVTALVVLPDGRLVSGSVDGTVHVWDLNRLTETARLEGHTGPVSAVAVLVDGRIASGGDDGTIRLWDTHVNAEIARFEGRKILIKPKKGANRRERRAWGRAKLANTKLAVTALAALPNGRLASALNDSSVRVWDLSSGAETAHLQVGPVAQLIALPDGSLVTSDSYSTMQVWSIDDGTACLKYKRKHDRPFARGDAGSLKPNNFLALLPDGRLASGLSGTIEVLNPSSGTVVANFKGPTSCYFLVLAPLPDGRLASRWDDYVIRVWEPKSRAVTAQLETTTFITALVGLPDGGLASGDSGGTITLWDLESRLNVIEGKTEVMLADATARQLDDEEVRAMAVLADGRVAAGRRGAIQLYDPRTGIVTDVPGTRFDMVTGLAALPDGRLASGLEGGTIEVWDPSSGTAVSEFKGYTGYNLALAALADGRLASGGFDGTIRLWDLRTAAETACLYGSINASVTSLAMLPDGRLASGYAEGTVYVWELSGGTVTAKFTKFKGSAKFTVWRLAALPDGRLACSRREQDQTIWIWDPNNGTEPACLEGHEGTVESLTILPGGRIASGGDDGTIRLWDTKCRAEITRLEVQGAVYHVINLTNGRLVARDSFGFMHWLKIVGE
jgi:WD40 repeat protein